MDIVNTSKFDLNKQQLQRILFLHNYCKSLDEVTCSGCQMNMRKLVGLADNTPMEIVYDKLKEDGLWI